MSPMARRLAASLTMTKCIDGLLEPDGDWKASATHSRMSSSGTSRVRSSRRRTARVVDSNWSGSRSSSPMSGNVARPLRRAATRRGTRDSAAMTAALDELVRLLDLEPIEVNIFRGRSPAERQQRVFGGQVAGQALVAAARTGSADRAVHSLHAYFLPPGDASVPILYEVDRIRDGRSFTTRRVVAIQHGEAIFNLQASFHGHEEGLDHQVPMPDVPRPETLPNFQQRMEPYKDTIGDWFLRP